MARHAWAPSHSHYDGGWPVRVRSAMSSVYLIERCAVTTDEDQLDAELRRTESGTGPHPVRCGVGRARCACSTTASIRARHGLTSGCRQREEHDAGRCGLRKFSRAATMNWLAIMLGEPRPRESRPPAGRHWCWARRLIKSRNLCPSRASWCCRLL